MAGAIIPNDWDGETYKCLRIQWPSSDLWEAILLGQVTIPALAEYWDIGTGDAEEAADAVVSAYRQTIQNIFTEECDEMGDTETISFKAYLSADQTVLAGDWRTIEFDTLDWDFGFPNYNTVDFNHDTGPEELWGLWRYEVLVTLAPEQTADYRVLASSPDTEIAQVKSWIGDLHLSFVFHWTGSLDELFIQVKLFSDGNIESEPFLTHLTGTRVGPIGIEAGESGTYDGQVSSGPDDAHENDAGGSFSHVGSNLKVESDTDAADRWNSGLRFTAVDIPNAATIDAAHIEVVYPVSTRDSPRFAILGYLAVNPDDFATLGDVTSLARTTASVPWSGDDLGHGSFISSPDIKTVIQELVDQGGWSEDDALIIILVGDDVDHAENCRTTPYDNTPAEAAKLHIEWST